MKNHKFFLIFALLLVTAHSCPKGCATCTAAQTQCLSCSQGYELRSRTKLCIPDYSRQSDWTGACNSGSRQTPIDFDTKNMLLCPTGFQFLHNTQTVVRSTQPSGPDLTASYIDLSTVNFLAGGRTERFNSLQFHWHEPSEHTVDGKYFDLQLHIVHVNTDGSGNLAVTGLFFNVDKEATRDILDKYNFFQSNSAQDFMFPMQMKNKAVYHYLGSLTTPPCSEIVTWFVYTEAFPVTTRNYELLKKQIFDDKPNSRNVQNLNGRKVYLTGGFCNQINVA